MRRGHLLIVPLLIALAVMAYQYFGAETFTNAETGERHRVGMSTEQEAELGLQAYQDVLEHEHAVTSGPELEMVKRVAAKLAAATGTQGADFDWRVSLVDSPEQNAFCLPGGKIVVYTGILPIAGGEAGLATVMGHEMAHATSRHGAQRVLQQQIAQTAMIGAQVSLSDMDPNQRAGIMAAIGAGAQYGVLLPFSRDHESEADKIGLHYMARAGYDPHEAVTFWERMSQMSQGRSPPEFASTHPSHETRVRDLQEEMPRAMQEFQAAKH